MVAQARAVAEPVDDLPTLGRIVEEAQAESPEAHVAVLLLLDAGMRLGEVMALRWGDVAWGADENDTYRHLHLRWNRPRGGAPEDLKSGRKREVKLSRRLRRALYTLYRKQFKPGPDAEVLAGMDASNFRKREWRRILERAKAGHVMPKQLRDSYGSWLLTAGVTLTYISRQLGHSSIAVTERHYAQYIDTQDYCDPLQREQGEHPADFLARIPAGWSQRVVTGRHVEASENRVTT